MKDQLSSRLPALLSAWLILLTPLFVSCTEDSPTTPSGLPEKPAQVAVLTYEITAPGEGTASELPLDPLRPGQLLVDTTQGMTRAVTGPRRFDDVEFTEVWYSSGRATFETNNDHGLVRFGDDEGGIYLEALLLAPATVRVGMKWTCKELDFEVTQRNVETTAWGDRPVWTIVERKAGGELTQCTRTYVEGHGIRSETCLVYGSYDAAIELLEPLEPIAAPPSEKLEPHEVAGVQWGIRKGAYHFWGIDIAPGEKPLVIKVNAQENKAVLYDSVQDSQACLQVDPGGDIFERLPSQVYGDPVTGIKTVIHGPPTCPYAEIKDHQWGFVTNRHAVTAWIRPDGADGVWYGSATSSGSLFAKDGHLVSDTLVALAQMDGDAGPTPFYWNNIGNVGWSLFQPLYGQLAGGEPRIAFVPPQANDGRLPVGLVMGSGLLANGTITKDSYIKDLHTGPFVGPFSTVRTTPDKRDVLLVSPGGIIDRLVLGPTGWERHPVATVSLPWGHSGFVGGFAISDQETGGERLLLFTRAFPKWTFTSGDEIVEESTVPITLAWNAPIPEVPPERPWLGALAVTAEKMGNDVRVCWPATGEPETAGWVLGGAPAVAIPHFDNRQCVAVFRDNGAALTADSPGGMVVEGPVPGVGTMRIAMPPGASTSTTATFSGGAPLSGGGFAAKNGVFDQGAVLIDPVQLDAPYAALFPDIAGHGMWYWVKGTLQQGLHLAGRDGIDTLFGLVGGEMVAMPSGGGIVILNELDGYRWYHPDGTVEELNSGFKNTYNVGFLSDGRVCGHGYNGEAKDKVAVYCYTPEGEPTVISMDPDHNFGTGGEQHWLPIADRYFINWNWNGYWILDADEETFSFYAESASREGLTYDASGRLFGRVDSVWSELTPDGPVALDLAGYEEQAATLYVDEEWFILLLNDSTVARVER